MGIKVSLDLQDLTYRELFDFVDLARGSNVDPSSTVQQIPIEGHDELSIDRFEVELPDGFRRPAPDLSEIDREHITNVLGSILDGDGDARHALAELRELRDRIA